MSLCLFCLMRQIKYMGFYMGGSGLDQTDDFQNFADQDWIGFNFCGSGLDWKISHSAHLCCTTVSVECTVYQDGSVINILAKSLRRRTIELQLLWLLCIVANYIVNCLILKRQFSKYDAWLIFCSDTAATILSLAVAPFHMTSCSLKYLKKNITHVTWRDAKESLNLLNFVIT